MNKMDLIALGMSDEPFEKTNETVWEHIKIDDRDIFVGCVYAVSHTARNKENVDVDLFLHIISICEEKYKSDLDVYIIVRMMIEEVIFEVYGVDLSLLPCCNN
jgi:hypothetical protein